MSTSDDGQNNGQKQQKRNKTQTKSIEIKPQGHKVERSEFGLDDSADNGKDPDRKMKEEG